MTTREGNRRAQAKWREKAENREREAKRRAERYKERERLATLRRRDTKEGWARHILTLVRHRCKKRGTEFDLSIEDIEVPDFCPVRGTRLKLVSGLHDPDLASIDRFDNSKGYVKGNVRVISLRANFLKKDATLEDIAGLYRYMAGGVPSPL
jgi:hypothetical protein